MNDYRDYLMHNGIKGQKWGERNGPPYPLKPEYSTGSRLRTDKERKEYLQKHKKDDGQQNKSYHQVRKDADNKEPHTGNLFGSRAIANKSREKDMERAVKYRRTLDEADLRKYISRLKLEKELKDLSDEQYKKNKKTFSETIRDITKDSAKSIGTQLLTGGAVLLLNSILFGGKKDSESINRQRTLFGKLGQWTNKQDNDYTNKNNRGDKR